MSRGVTYTLHPLTFPKNLCDHFSLRNGHTPLLPWKKSLRIFSATIWYIYIYMSTLIMASKNQISLVTQSFGTEETVKGKKAFKQFCKNCDVEVMAYHANNSIFAANGWREDCIKNNQTLIFAGVNAHHTNGLAERRIKELTEMNRTKLKFAFSRWKHAISANYGPTHFVNQTGYWTRCHPQ